MLPTIGYASSEFSLYSKGDNVLRQRLIDDIASFIDNIYVQEHCILKQPLYEIDKCVPHFKSQSILGMSEHTPTSDSKSI